MEGVARTSTTSASAVQRAAATMQAAHASHARAVQQSATAERDLSRLMQNSSRTAEQVAAAEQRVAAARAQVAQSTVRAQDSLANLNRENAAAAQSTNSLTTALGKAKSAAAMMGVTVGAAGSIKFFTDAINNARALGAQTNQLTVLFGDSQSKVLEWGKSASETMRMSQREAQGAAIQFATFGKAIGKSGGDLVVWSQDLTKLAGNLASFYGMDTATAVEAMSSAFAGSAETMRPYGVLLDDATLRTLAFEAGITETNRQLTSQEKIMATYIGMKQQLAHVDGDIERSSGKYGASLKELKSRYEDVSASIGGKLIPIANTLVQVLSGPGMQVFGFLADKIGGLAEGVRMLGSVFGMLPGPIQAVIASLVAGKIASLALAPAMARVATSITSVATTARLQGMMAMDRLRTAMFNASATTSVWTRTAGTAGSAAAGLGRGVRSAATMMGGPWMIAATAGILLLARHAAASQKARQHQDELAQATQGVAAVLNNSGGGFTAAGQAAAATAMETIKLEGETKSLADALEELGVSGAQAAKGLAGNESAASKTREELKALREEAEANDSVGSTFWSTLKDNFGDVKFSWPWESGVDVTHDTLAGKAEEEYSAAEAAIRKKQEALKRAAESGGDVVIASNGTAYVGAMTEAMEEFDKASSSAAKQVDILAKALSGLRDDDLTIHDAETAVNAAMRDMEGLKGTLGNVGLDKSGQIDTRTEAGAKGDAAVRSAAEAYDQLAAAIFTTTGSAQAVEQAMQGTYDQFVNNATAMLGSREQAEQLAASLGLIPKDAAIELSIKNEAQTRQLVDAIKGEVTGFDNTTATVTVNALTDDAKNKLQAAGFAIEAVPDGKGFTLTAATADAIAALNGAKGAVDGIPATKPITVETPGANEAIARLTEAGVLTHVDNEKRIVVQDNSADTIIALAKLNVTTTTLADGTVVITDNSAAVRTNIEKNLDGKQTRGTHTIYQSIVGAGVTAGTSGGNMPTAPGSGTGSTPFGAANGAIFGAFAQGGVNRLPKSAKIQQPQANLIQWAEPETGGEAFIPLARSKRARSTQILAETARRMGMEVVSKETAKIFKGDPKSLANRTDPTGWRSLLGGDYNPKLRRFGIEEDHPLVGAVLSVRNLIANGDYDGELTKYGFEEDHPTISRLLDFNKMLSFANGGFTPSVGGLDALAQSFEGKGYSWGATGYETDCSGMQSALANYADGRDPFSSRTGTGGMDAFLKERGFVPGMGSKGALSIGWYNGGPYGGHTAGTLPNGVNVEMGGARGNGQYGGGAASAAGFPNIMHRVMADMIGIDFDENNDPDGMKALMQDGDFTGRFAKAYGVEEDDPLVDKLLEYRTAKLAGETFDGELNEENDPDGIKALMEKGDYTGRFRTAYGAEEDSKLVDGLLKARKNGYQKDATATLKDATSAATSTGSVQDVYVTNWPGTQAAAAKEEERKPKFRIGFEMFENGGFGNLPSQASLQAPQKNLVQWAEPSTQGEAFIPLAASKRARSSQILGKVANKFGYELVPNSGLQAFAEGGFGGNQGSLPETAAVTLSSKTGIQAGGAASVALAGFAHLIANMTTGDLNTGSAPGLTEPIKKAVEDQMTALHKQILELTGRAEQLRQELKDAEAAGDNVRADRIRAQLKMTDEEARAASDEYADLKTEAATAPRTSSGGSDARSSQRLSAQEQNVVDSIGPAAKGEGNNFTFHIGQIANGPVTVNDPNDLMEHKTGDPIGDAMRAVGVR